MAAYEQSIRLFNAYLIGEKGIENEKQVTSAIIDEYVKYLRNRGKYTVVNDSNSKKSNFPDNRRDNGDVISTTSINNYLLKLQ